MHPRNRIVLITGASSGIGAAIARVFAHAGAHVVLAARNEERLAALAVALPGEPFVVPTDVSDPQAVARLVAQTMARFGRIDILINNAGVGLAGPVTELHSDDLQKALAVDLFGPLYATQAVVPHMRAARRGQIMNISSVVGLRALPYLGGYAAAKAALDRLTESLRVELRGSGIAVTLVRPGTTSTGFSQRRLGTGREQRRVTNKGVSADTVALAVLRAACREPRVAYVSLRDRLQIAVAALAPSITDRLLARSFSWND